MGSLQAAMVIAELAKSVSVTWLFNAATMVLAL